jgi:hypothetical protein
MLETNGITPKLSGHICEALLCQQYWYRGKLANELDVLFIKADGRCHQLYFENGVVFWRSQAETPKPYVAQLGDEFDYPLVDLAAKYKLNGQLITDLAVEPMPQGAKVTIAFENGARLVIYHQENQTSVRYAPA